MIFKIIFLLSVINLATSRTLPSFVQTCKKNDPNLDKCLMSSIENLRIKLLKGIPELRIPSLDPLKLPELKFEQVVGAINFRATFKNLVAEGSKDFILRKIKINSKTSSIIVEVFLPKMKVISDYNINGNILVMPINGEGKWNGNFSNIVARVILKGNLEKKNHKTYITIKHQKMNLKIGGSRMNFANLFNGNKELSDSTNRFINANWRDILFEINPVIQKTVGEIVVQMSKGLLETYALEELLS